MQNPIALIDPRLLNRLTGKQPIHKRI